ncbi:uncharacterized protein BXZ73DRAFT_100936 [Epithele typhae]|uniref:uncharacterized protein n=1 Tax=Epithele typhae TaxID=378194 RepID=UPI002007E677|nr:uncharacterized protein BXZ73DRAFT_100936 [Epithele typhae]KAH9933551.1 hypothetical protein BXZ73DRAFT_100936 [Epithele typhae]
MPALFDSNLQSQARIGTHETHRKSRLEERFGLDCIVHIMNGTYSAKEADNFIYAALSIILTKPSNSRPSLSILGEMKNQYTSIDVSRVLRATNPHRGTNDASSNPTSTDDFYDGAYAVSEPSPLEARQQQQQRSFRHPYTAEIMTP